jgi:proteic killer suppression protein
VNSEHAEKISVVLARLDRAAKPDDMNLPGLKLRSLKGELTGFWSVTVRANWRIIFRFDGADTVDVDLVDYH